MKKKKSMFIIATMFACFLTLGGALSVNAQNNEVPIVFSFDDDTPMEPGNPKTPIPMPTVWQSGYLLDFHSTHDNYVLRLVDATDTVVYSTVVPWYQTQVWLPTYLVGIYRIELLTDLWLFYGAITL